MPGEDQRQPPKRGQFLCHIIFDLLLNEAGVVCTPGAGFGTCGEGHIRISAFNSREKIVEAMGRIKAALESAK